MSRLSTLSVAWSPLALGTLFVAAPASAQTIPMHSGHMGHGAPQMRVHASGLHYPNRPKYHHHYGYAGYRSPHIARTEGKAGFEANTVD